MVTAAIIIIIAAAILGAILLFYVLTGKPTPKGIAFIHGPLAITGLIVLIIYAVTTAKHHKHLESIVLFSIAAVGGVVVFYRDITGKSIPKWLAVLHGVIALTGIGFILFHTFSGGHH